MTNDNDPNKKIPLEETIAVIEELSRCKPLSPSDRRTSVETFAGVFANWCLGLSGLCLAPPALMVFFFNTVGVSVPVKTLALASLTASLFIAFAALLAPIVATGWTLLRWETVTLQNLKADIQHEQNISTDLRKNSADALKEAKMWLELKIKRVDARVTWFFGDKTAVLTLMATAYLFSKEFGGFGWLQKTLQAGPGISNLGDTTLLYMAALILGLSIGAVFLRHIAARYRYQVELIDLALR